MINQNGNEVVYNGQCLKTNLNVPKKKAKFLYIFKKKKKKEKTKNQEEKKTSNKITQLLL